MLFGARGDLAIDTQSHPDVFVSYSRKDEDQARPLIEELGRAGFSVWWDGMLEAGTVYTRTTEEALENALAVVVVWSKQSVHSNWVRDEAQSGRDRSRLVPVSIDGSLPPLGFRQYQSVDLSGWDGSPEAAQFVNVRSAVARLADPAFEPAPIASPPAVERKRRGILDLGGTFGKVAAALTTATIAGAGLLTALGFAGGEPRDANGLAIMPFENLSENEDHAYFSTGLAEELRQSLSQHSDLPVAAQASSDLAAKEGGDARDIARRLGVRYLLSGSVRREADTVRVTVQLIDGDEGFDIWSQGYNRKLEDIFTVQSDIARHVVDSLKAKLEQDHPDNVARIGGTRNASAYDAYLRGVAIYDVASGEESDRAAQAQLEAAIKADPEYGAAWAALSRVQTTIANSYTSAVPLSEQYAVAMASARKAITVAPRLATGYAALGYVLLNGKLDVASAKAPYTKAHQLAPKDADILGAYGTYMGHTGNFEEARKAYDTAVSLDPLNATTKRQYAQILYAAGQLDEAQATIEQALALNPELGIAKRILADIAYQKGEYRRARDLYEEEKSSLSRLAGLAIVRRKLGDESGARAAMARLKSEFGDNGLYQQAQVLAQWGNRDEALDTLEQAFAAGDSGLVLLRDDPKLAPLQGDVRFRRLLGRIGFT